MFLFYVLYSFDSSCGSFREHVALRLKNFKHFSCTYSLHTSHLSSVHAPDFASFCIDIWSLTFVALAQHVLSSVLVTVYMSQCCSDPLYQRLMSPSFTLITSTVDTLPNQVLRIQRLCSLARIDEHWHVPGGRIELWSDLQPLSFAMPLT